MTERRAARPELRLSWEPASAGSGSALPTEASAHARHRRRGDAVALGIASPCARPAAAVHRPRHEAGRDARAVDLVDDRDVRDHRLGHRHAVPRRGGLRNRRTARRRGPTTPSHGLLPVGLIHAVHVTGLDPGTRYTYKAVSTRVVKMKAYWPEKGLAAETPAAAFTTLRSPQGHGRVHGGDRHARGRRPRDGPAQADRPGRERLPGPPRRRVPQPRERGPAVRPLARPGREAGGRLAAARSSCAATTRCAARSRATSSTTCRRRRGATTTRATPGRCA